nr:RNA-directed DNA polymerase, eukaryota, reverse transcriptase zinc-binding domain protein [Tanacetum cinerariifolium]
MDKMTTMMCKDGYGRLGFARVLPRVEILKNVSKQNNHADKEGFVDVRSIKNMGGQRDIEKNNELVHQEKKRTMERMENENSKDEDVFESHNQAVNSLIADEVLGSGDGDFNVTLKPEEHSSGSSIMSGNIGEFRDAINSLEIEDLCSTGFHFTWTKSLKNPQNSILKKLDKIMMNDDFLEHYGQAHAEDEIKLLHQKMKIKWLSEGDRNTAYFHKVLKARKHKCTMESICGEDGQRFQGNDVPEKFVKHFNKFLGVTVLVSPLSPLGNTVNLKLSQVEAKNMIIESAFVPGRHIQDNILITQELLRGYNKKSSAKRCAMKIDLQKAYDTIN